MTGGESALVMNGSLRLREGPRGWFASFSWRVAISYVVLVLCLLAVQGMMVGFVVARANAQMQGRLPGLPLARAAATVGAALEADSGLSIERALAAVTVPAAGSRHVTERHRAQADAAGVTIAVAVDDGADQMTGDPHLLEQAVDNLVVNALRHAPAGSRIVLHATAGEGGVALTVSDSGPGIGPHHAARSAHLRAFLQDGGVTPGGQRRQRPRTVDREGHCGASRRHCHGRQRCGTNRVHDPPAAQIGRRRPRPTMIAIQDHRD